MFVDKVEVTVQAGNGGDGKMSFRHEKFVARGGPDGGDGGNGGDVILQASRNQDTLVAFRYKKLLKAENGQPGGKDKKHGRSGQDLIVPVPVGTMVVNDHGVVADLTSDGQTTTIAKGGKGGFGNAHFTSSTRQAPRVAEKGELGDHLKTVLELKMIADVGIVGLPNAGKSTLLATISNARPQVADYPFTTLTPNLGVVDIGRDASLLFADIPGLIEGASQGKGLGDEFLRHVERTAVLLHLIDAYNEDVAQAFKTIQKELADYSVDLSKRPQIVALTKVEGLDEEMIKDKLAELQKVVPKKTLLMAISSPSRAGIKELLFTIQKLVARQRRQSVKNLPKTGDLPVYRLVDDNAWQVSKTKTGFAVSGTKIERFAQRTDFASDQAVARLRDIMRKMGIMHELERQGIEAGQKIKVGQNTLIY